MKNLNNEHYNTSDMCMAVTLSLHFPILDIIKSDPKRVVFTFDKTQEFSDFIEKYWHNEIAVNPIEYFNQIKNIKRRLYEES